MYTCKNVKLSCAVNPGGTVTQRWKKSFIIIYYWSIHGLVVRKLDWTRDRKVFGSNPRVDRSRVKCRLIGDSEIVLCV